MRLNDTCVFCGEEIPEGRQVCPICEKNAIESLAMPRCLFKKVYRGDVYLADLSPVIGSETGGVHPIIIIQNNVGNKSGPTIIAAVGTSAKKPCLPVHVCLKAGSGGLSKDTIVQLEQIRTLDKRRLKQYIGHLGKRQMKLIDDAAKISIGLKTQEIEGEI